MTEQQAKVDRRKRLMVDKRAQGHLIRLLALFVAAALVLFVMIIIAGGAHGHGLSVIKLLVSLLFSMILILIGVVYIGLRFSNKIVGPMYNFGRNLQLIQRGDYTSEVRLRHGDEFQNMAGVFNLALEALRERVRDDLKLLDEIAAALGQADAKSLPNKDALLGAIEERRAAKQRHITRQP